MATCLHLDFGYDLVQQRAQVLPRRQRKIEHGDFLFQFGGDFQDGRHQQDRFEAVLEVQGDVLELANDGEMIAGQERVKILENKKRRLDLLDDHVQRGQRILGGGVAALLGLDGRADGTRPVGATPFKTFLRRLAAMSLTASCTRVSSLEMT
jgi:hypothetical protein